MSATEDELRPEYGDADFNGAARGKYAKRFAAGTNLGKIDADLITEFADEQVANDALRWMLTLPSAVERLTKRTG
ncbi:MAG TPA: hypothetical protein VHX65_20445 [Pirellulales bacterium]|jgi:hypothetical protein|nr:hypothetical protein [Pirellulales bacterium]